MGILSGIKPQAISKTLERLILDVYGGGTTASGVAVNSDTAMRLITVQTCVRVKSDTIKQIPLHIMERDGDLKTKAKDFYLYEKLHDQPNDWMTAPEFWGMAEAHLELRGNFYAYKSGLPGRKIQQLIPIPQEMMRKVTQNEDYSLDYEIRFPNGEIKHLNNKQIMHIRGLTLNGYMGVNPIEYARETLGLGLAGEKFLARFFGNGLHPGIVMEHPLTLSGEAHKKLRAGLTEKYAGLSKTHELMLIDEGMKAVFPAIKLVDAQFLELTKMTEAQICGLLRVPLMLIQSGNQAPTYASAEQFMLSYVVHSFMPILVNIESAIRRDLFTPEERQKYYAKFSVDGLLRGDFKTRMTGYQVAINTEIMSPNEARALEDWNPYDGGSDYRTRTSTIKESDKTTEEPKEVEEQ